MTGAEALVRTAAECGIEICFANAGTTEAPLVAALDAVGGIRPVPGLFEGVCTGAADGYGRATARPAMALLHLGPGLGNGVANLHNARRARTPVVNVIGEHATWHRTNDPPLAMDVEGLARTVSGWVRTATRADTLAGDMAEAVAAALRGGVSTLIVPNDVQTAQAARGPAPGGGAVFDGLDAGAIERAARLLSGAKKGAIVLGGRALRAEGLAAAGRIRAATGCGLLTGSFPGYIDRGGGLPPVTRLPFFPEPAIEILSPFDAFVLAGAGEPVSFFGYPGLPGRLIPEGRDKVSIWSEGQDEVGALTALADALGAPARAPAGGGQAETPEIPKGALTAEKVCMVLAAMQPEGAIIVDEGLTTAFSYYRLSAAAPAHSLVAVSGGAIGYGMPCALGAALAYPERKVINLEADGSALYTVQALWTQAREGVDVTTLICSNRSYRIVEMELSRSGLSIEGASARAFTRLSPPEVNWVDLAKGFGVEAVRAATAEELSRALERGLREPGPHLVEMVLP